MAENINNAIFAIIPDPDSKKMMEFNLEGPYSPRFEELQQMKQELEDAQRCLAEKDEKMCKMSRMQDTVDQEVQELTEKLFQEAYKMVNVAEERREKAERLLEESRNQMEMLTAEVSALKVLVQTPGMGQNHFHNTSPEHKSTIMKIFSSSSSSSKKSSSSQNGSSSNGKKSNSLPTTSNEKKDKERNAEQKEADSVEEVDPILFGEFSSWRDSGHPFVNHTFIDRIQREEVTPCMEFSNHQLSSEILDSIAGNQLEMEPIHEDRPEVKVCSLTEVSRFCPYRVRTNADSEFRDISFFARNRIAAVCDYFTFLRYLNLGLIKPGLRDSYFALVALRKNMCLAKLGLGFVPKSNLRPSY